MCNQQMPYVLHANIISVTLGTAQVHKLFVIHMFANNLLHMSLLDRQHWLASSDLHMYKI